MLKTDLRVFHYNAAIAFTIGFYDALRAGETIESTYNWGCSAIQFEISGHSIRKQ